MGAVATLFPPLATNNLLAAYAWRLYAVTGPGKGEAVVALGTVETYPEPGRRRLSIVVVEINAWSPTPVILMKNSASYNGLSVCVADDYVGVQKQWQGRGIGSLGLNTLVEWALQYSPTIPVESLLLASHAPHERLARFYGQFGFRWNLTDTAGILDRHRSLPMTVGDLKRRSGSTELADLPGSLGLYRALTGDVVHRNKYHLELVKELRDRHRRSQRRLLIGGVILSIATFFLGRFLIC